MSDEVVADRKAGMTVTLCGLGFSGLVLYVVHLLNESDVNPMGFYVNGVIPAGALLVGICSGLGFAFASRVFQVPLGRGHVWGMVLTGLFTYWIAQYETYSYLIGQAGVPADQYPFSEYIKDSCEQMAFQPKNARDQAKPLGGWGYFFKFLEMAGYVGGAVIPAAVVKGMPFCRRCQKYLKKEPERYRNTTDRWADIKKLPKQDAATALQTSVAALTPQIQADATRLAAATWAETTAFLAELSPKMDLNAVANVTFTVHKCPACDAHQLTMTLTHRTYGNDAPQQLAKLEKMDPPTMDAPAES